MEHSCADEMVAVQLDHAIEPAPSVRSEAISESCQKIHSIRVIQRQDSP